MNLFINDIPVRVQKKGSLPPDDEFNFIIDAAKEPILKAKFIHHLLIKRASLQHVGEIFEIIHSNNVPLLSIHLQVESYPDFKNFLRKKYTLVKAAGGLVRKKGRVLMIYRLKRWDLPKGKRENNESNQEAAAREVTEECGVKVKVGKKICTTWHTYTMNRSNMLKRTRWYVMDVLDDTKMRPETAEDIEEVRWMSRKELYHALENSYRSIRFVFEKYYRRKVK